MARLLPQKNSYNKFDIIVTIAWIKVLTPHCIANAVGIYNEQMKKGWSTMTFSWKR